MQNESMRPLKLSEYKLKYMFAKEIPFGEGAYTVVIDSWKAAVRGQDI